MDNDAANQFKKPHLNVANKACYLKFKKIKFEIYKADRKATTCI